MSSSYLMATDTFPVVYFGKIPTHGDFVRHAGAGTALREMDTWLQRGLRYAADHLGGAFNDAFNAVGSCSFYLALRGAERVLAGVLQPSHDSVGRAYPFLVALEVDRAHFNPRTLAHVPLRFNPFFEHAATITGEAAAGHLDRHTLTERTDALSASVSDDTSVAFFEQYLRQARLSAFWQRLWGHPQDSRKYLLFKNLLEIVLKLRDGIPPGYPLVLRFPLCPDGRTLDYDVSFWLGLCLRLLNYPDIEPSFLWMHPDQKRGTAPFLLLALHSPAPKTFAHLLPAPLESDTLCVLETLGAQNAALAALSIPDRYSRMIEDENLTLRDFLQQL